MSLLNVSQFWWQPTRHMRLVTAISMLLATNSVADDVHPHHLVGHEDAELLARVQDVIDDWDPRKLENPLVETSQSLAEVFAREPDGTITIRNGQPVTEKKLVIRKQLRRPDLAEFIADVDAAEALGKAFFWEMQAGSDFEVVDTPNGPMARGTACASCHYRNGADARNRHTARIPYVVWDQYKLDDNNKVLPLEQNGAQLPFPVDELATQNLNPQQKPFGKFSLIVGSQGVEAHEFHGFEQQNGWLKEKVTPKTAAAGASKFEWEMFNGRRQITSRNSPTIINSGFSNRLFHDGRAESTFNGFSTTGDADPRVVIHRVRKTPRRDADGRLTAEPPDIAIVPVRIALTNAALASQAVGPIINEVEMSYDGREFPNVAYKLLDAKVLGFQRVASTDSLLSRYAVGRGHAAGITYRQLIQRAFRSDWWDDGDDRITGRTPLILLQGSIADGTPTGSLMEGNFSLYWALSIMLYEASLVSNQTPFDEMMRGRPEQVEAKWQAVRGIIGEPISRDQKSFTGGPIPHHQSGSAVFQHGFRVFMNHGCIDCHDGPFFSEQYERRPEQEPFPIQYLIDRALLPNSRADALIANLRPIREDVLKTLATKIAAEFPEATTRTRKMAIEMEELRHRAKGLEKLLRMEIQQYLQQYLTNVQKSVNPAFVEECAKLIFDYEKYMVQHLGNRTFFPEVERVSMAEMLARPMGVEWMPIPQQLFSFRRPLPIGEQTPRKPYAFYDQGFYALGVSPARYDRGIGEHEAYQEIAEERAIDEVGQRLSLNSDPQLTAQKQLFSELFSRYQQTGDAKAAIDSISSLGTANSEVDPNVLAVARVILAQQLSQATIAAEQIPASSTLGRAYRLNAAWRTERFRSNGFAPEPKVVPKGVDAPAADRSRKSSEGPRGQQTVTAVPADTSWDRDNIPNGDITQTSSLPGRRSAYHFFSRARRMVFQEEHWGYRKPFLHDNELAFWGAFKTPTLRNVELTAPYMHNGRLMSLVDVIEFYDEQNEQAPLSQAENPDKHPDMTAIEFQRQDDIKALEFFLRCLTDDRVLYEQGPFDHPSLSIVNGYQVTTDGQLSEVFFEVEAVGEEGHVGIPTSSFPSQQ